MTMPSCDPDAALGSYFSDGSDDGDHAVLAGIDDELACTDQVDSAASESRACPAAADPSVVSAVAAQSKELRASPCASDPRAFSDVVAENEELRRSVLKLEEKVHNLQGRLDEMQAQMEESEQSWSDGQRVWRTRFEAERARLHLELNERAEMAMEDERGLLQREVVSQISRAMETLREQSEGLIGCSEHLEAENERLKQLLREHIAERKAWVQQQQLLAATDRSTSSKGPVSTSDSSSQTPNPEVPTEPVNPALERFRQAGVDLVVHELLGQVSGMLEHGLRTKSVRALEAQSEKLDAAIQVVLGQDLQPDHSTSALHSVALRLKGLSGQFGCSSSRCFS